MCCRYVTVDMLETCLKTLVAFLWEIWIVYWSSGTSALKLTVDMKQWSRFSSENKTPSLMKTALALRMKEKKRLMWM